MLLPFFQTSWDDGVVHSAIFNSFHNLVEFGTILEDLRNFGGRGFKPPTPPRYATATRLFSKTFNPCSHFRKRDPVLRPFKTPSQITGLYIPNSTFLATSFACHCSAINLSIDATAEDTDGKRSLMAHRQINVPSIPFDPFPNYI